MLTRRNSFVPLRSAYENYYHGQEPLVTNYSYEFIGCLDYIFYNSGSNHIFEKCGVVDLPSNTSLAVEESLPSASIPSDHLPIELLGRIHPMKRDAEEPPRPQPPSKTRAEMCQPFFKHVYGEEV